MKEDLTIPLVDYYQVLVLKYNPVNLEDKISTLPKFCVKFLFIRTNSLTTCLTASKNQVGQLVWSRSCSGTWLARSGLYVWQKTNGHQKLSIF